MKVTYPNGVKETRGYDSLTRMTNLVYKKWLTTLLSIDYRHDNGDRRTNEVWSTGRSLSYGYDRAHQLLSAVSTGRASDAVNYVYDKAGNPTSRKELGLTTAYAFNNLNQFSSGSWTGKLTVIGEVNYAAGTVTVNGVTGKIFPDRVFEATNITVSAGTNVLTAVYHGPAFTNTQMVATNTSSVVVVNPAFGYDAKGNPTNDAEFVYQYDIANRLTNVVSKASGSSVLAARYDGLWRRVEVTRNGSAVERYVYFPGSFLVLAVLNGSNQIKEIYTHGPDLSGVVGGAGGIGGILSVSTNIGAASAVKYFHADAMGNVILVSDSSGKQVASYGFTPFGKLVNQVGDYQARFLFSGKEYDSESGLVLYGHRYLKPSSGTWLTRDLIGEAGGILLYGFVDNNPVQYVDADGLARYDFRQRSCELRVLLTWGLAFRNDTTGKWTWKQRSTWKREAVSTLESYFNSVQFKCFPARPQCPICPSGVGVRFDLQYKGFFTFWRRKDYDVAVVYDPTHQSFIIPSLGLAEFDSGDVKPQNKGASQPQIPIVHETGHMLGLPHPGQRLTPPAAPNSRADYLADFDSLMGGGMSFRLIDFDDAFCSKITTGNQCCDPWCGR